MDVGRRGCVESWEKAILVVSLVGREGSNSSADWIDAEMLVFFSLAQGEKLRLYKYLSLLFQLGMIGGWAW